MVRDVPSIEVNLEAAQDAPKPQDDVVKTKQKDQSNVESVDKSGGTRFQR